MTGGSIGTLATVMADATAWVDHSRDGRRVRTTHAELLTDARQAAARLGHHVPAGRPYAILGPPGYPWLVAALAGMLLGRRIVAVPETMSATELVASVAGLDLAGVVLGRDDPRRSVLGDLSGEMAMCTFEALLCPAGPSAGSPEVAGPAEEAGPMRLDLVAYTSGTTAQVAVKCFDVTAESTEHFARTFVEVFQLAPGDVWVVCHSFSHVVHFEYVLACLLHGLNVVLATPLDVIMNARGHQPAALITVPGVYEQLATFLQTRVARTRRGRLAWAALRAIPDRLLGRPATRRLCQILLPEVREVTGGRLKVMIIGAAPSTFALKRTLLRLGLPMYEGYGMSEVGMITCHRPGDAVLGTIGRPWPGIATRIAEDGVLQISAPFRRATRYLNVDGPAALIVDDDGWIDTGDLVRQLPNGHFVITGRRKNILVTDRGKNVNARAVEARLEESPQVAHAVLYGDGKPFLTAVIALRSGSTADGVDQLVATVNATVAEHERLLGYVIADVPFGEHNGLLTRSGKIRRTAVLDRYGVRLEALYLQREII